MSPLVAEILDARQKRAETLHDLIFSAREAIRLQLKPDSPEWLRKAFNDLHAAHHVLGGDPFDMHIRAALDTEKAAREAAEAKAARLEEALEFIAHSVQSPKARDIARAALEAK